ncbi:DUF2155 domain-containing protein [Rhizobium sp. CAU 1783]
MADMKRFGRGSTLAVLGMAALSVSAATLAGMGTARAERISNPVAEFAGIDKITGRITSFDVYIDETVQFGALQVTPKVCYSRDETEAQKIDGFVEVDEITLDRKIRRIFSGWMFADSPALNAVEHAIYDVWLTGCKEKSDVPAPPGVKAAHAAPEPAKAAAAPAPATDGTAQPSVDPGAAAPADAAPAVGLPGEAAPGVVPPLDAPQEIPQDVPGDALPPTDFPQDGLPQDGLPQNGFPEDGQPVPEGQLLPPADVGTPPGAGAPPPGVGLY